MLTKTYLSAILLMLALVAPANAQKLNERPMPPEFSWAVDEPIVRNSIIVGLRALNRGESPDEATMTNVVTWLSNVLGLPAVYDHPRIERLPKTVLAQWSQGDQLGPSSYGIMSRYDDGRRTIHLPADWRGDSPAEISILLHQVVHHLQNVGGLRYGCPEERQKLAYLAQEKWLVAFGTGLKEKFAIDGDTFLFLTECYIP